MKTFAELQKAIADLPDADFRVFIDKTKARSVDGVPPELAKLYATWGMLAVEVNEAIWARPKEFEVHPAWRFQFGFHVFQPEGTQRAFLRRTGTKFLFVLTDTGVATWQEGTDLEDEPHDPIACVLREIDMLKNGLDRIRQDSMNAATLVDAGQKAGWTGPSIGPLLDSLKKQPAAELAPHVRTLVDALLAGGRFSMGVLDILATAGPEAFRTVADSVYAYDGVRPYVIELLGKVSDSSPQAIAIYRKAFEGDDDDEIDQAFTAVKAIAKSPTVRELVPLLHSKLGEWESDRKGSAIALLSHLGEPVIPLVATMIDGSSGSELGGLLRELEGTDVSSLAPALLAKLRSFDPKDRGTIEAVEGLVAVGIEDRATMEPILRDHFVPRGGRWKTRSEAILARWK